MGKTPVATANEIAAARRRGLEDAAIEPRAVRAYYDAERGSIMVELKNGCWFGFQPSDVREIAGATPAQLSQVEIAPGAYGLRWDELDIDISLPGLMFDLLKVKAWAGRWTGQQKSEAKAAASRENGKKGGRPRKQSQRPDAPAPVLAPAGPRKAVADTNRPAAPAKRKRS